MVATRDTPTRPPEEAGGPGRRRSARAERERRRIAADIDRERIGEALEGLRRRSHATVRDRVHRVRTNFILALQAGVAATLAWFVAADVIGNPDPVFAPLSAVGTLASSVGQRWRRTVELIVGVAVGIGIGDGLIALIGIGSWQLGLVVVLAIIGTIFLGGSPAVIIQAASTGVLLVTLTPRTADIEFPRVVDALVGGVMGLVVIALLLPFNPLRIVDRAARPAMERLADDLVATAEALERKDPDCAQTALDRLKEVERHMQGLEEALEGGRETATIAPLRWHRRGALIQYVESAEFIDHAVHNSGTLVRRAVTAIEDDEPIPAPLASAVALLAETVRTLLRELGHGVEPERTRECALRSVSEAGRAYNEGVGFSGSVVVAQLRTTASDLLRATGIERREANRLVRRAVASATEEPAAKSMAEPPSGEPAAHAPKEAAAAPAESGRGGQPAARPGS